MRQKIRKSLPHALRAKLSLGICMALIGIFTLYASANTYEVIAKDDIPFSSVIKTISLSEKQLFNDTLQNATKTPFNTGSFGIPKKIKFSETKQHIEIIPARYNANGWLASTGLAQTFVTANQQQKVFGEAIIYLRYNTATTQHLGNILSNDIVNIVTTEGWQLGYQVSQTSNDPANLDRSLKPNASRIIVIMVNDDDNSVKCFQASLVKVGERI